MREYDDGLDLTNYDFSNDGFLASALHDDSNKKKLAYRHRIISHKYKKVFFFLSLLLFLLNILDAF